MLRPVFTAIVALINDQEAKFLVGKRPMDKKNYPGWWEFPGGKVEAGETAAQAAVREMAEEVGVVIQPKDLIALGETVHDYPELEETGIKVFCTVFACHRWTGSPVSNEGQELAWVHPNELSQYQIVPGDVPRLPLVCKHMGIKAGIAA